MLATIVYPTDREPLFVLVQTPARLLVQRVSVADLKPVGAWNGFPVFEHEFTEQEASQRAEGEVFSVFFDRQAKEYRYSDCPVRIGQAKYYRNFSD